MKKLFLGFCAGAAVLLAAPLGATTFLATNDLGSAVTLAFYATNSAGQYTLSLTNVSAGTSNALVDVSTNTWAGVAVVNPAMKAARVNAFSAMLNAGGANLSYLVTNGVSVYYALAVPGSTAGALAGASSYTGTPGVIGGVSAPGTAYSYVIVDTNGSLAAPAQIFGSGLGLKTAGASLGVNNFFANYHRSLYSNTVNFAENWASGAAWNLAGVTAGGGLVYGSGGNPAAANRSYLITTNSLGRIVGSLTVPLAGVAANYCFLGVSKDVGGAAPTAGGANILGVGVAGGHNYLQVWNGGATVGGDGTILTNGTYYFNISIDTNYISFVALYPGHTNEMRYQLARSSWTTISNVALWCGDARGASGMTLGPVAARLDTPTIGGAAAEHQSDFVIWTKDDGGQPIRVWVPQQYDSVTNAADLIVFCHGAGWDENFPFTGQTSVTNGLWERNFFQSLVNSNYIVASSFGHGDNWGGTNVVADTLNLINWVRARYAVNRIFMIGASMGGATALNFIAAHQVEVSGYVGLYPVCSLWSMYPGYGAAMLAAYGSTNYSVLAQFDATLRPNSRYLYYGVPMQLYASPADGTVAKTLNADVLTNVLAGMSAEISEVVCAGGHGDASHLQASNVAAFFQRCKTFPYTQKPNFNDASYGK